MIQISEFADEKFGSKVGLFEGVEHAGLCMLLL